MRNQVLWIVLLLLFVGSIQSADSQAQTCGIAETSATVQRAIDGWIAASEYDRSGAQSAELQRELSNGDRNCRDQKALKWVAPILDIRDDTSTTALESAHSILDSVDVYDISYRRQAVDFLIREYKLGRQYAELVSLSQKPVLKKDTYTWIAARNGYVIASYALRGAAETVEMLRPLLNMPVEARDWWLMQFASAMAEKSGDSELAAAFSAKADGIFEPVRVFEIPSEFEGDRADRIFSYATSETYLVRILPQPISPPKPAYPSTAARRRLTGYCDVVFDITLEGRTENVRAYCSSKIFAYSAERAIKKIRFPTQIPGFEPREDVVYPLEYLLR